MTTLTAKSPPVLSQPTILTISGSQVLAASARPLVRVSATTTASLMLLNGRSHWITNAGALSFTVSTTGNPGYTLAPGNSVVCAWNGPTSTHTLAGIAAPGGVSGGGGTTVVNLVHAAHGRVTGEIGRPLSNQSLFVDTDAFSFPTGILLNVVDSQTIQVAEPGAVVTLPVSLLEGGAAFNPLIGRRVWFDTSATLYKQLRQTDTQSGIPSQLYILSVGATTFQALVQPLVPTSWRKFADFKLTATHITNRACGVVGAGLASDLRVFANGHLISTEDAVFNALTGVLSWDGLTLQSQAQAGWWIQGEYEPFV